MQITEPIKDIGAITHPMNGINNITHPNINKNSDNTRGPLILLIAKLSQFGHFLLSI
jgi:hypothetical protein